MKVFALYKASKKPQPLKNYKRFQKLNGSSFCKNKSEVQFVRKFSHFCRLTIEFSLLVCLSEVYSYFIEGCPSKSINCEL